MMMPKGSAYFSVMKQCNLVNFSSETGFSKRHFYTLCCDVPPTIMVPIFDSMPNHNAGHFISMLGVGKRGAYQLVHGDLFKAPPPVWNYLEVY